MITIIQEFYTLKSTWKNIRNNQSYDETILNEKLTKNELIKSCHEKTLNFHYGPALQRPVPYVVPYVAAKKPSERSTFSDFWFSLALTVKYYLEEDFDAFTNWMDDKIKEQLHKMYQKDKDDPTFNDIWDNGVMKNCDGFQLFIHTFVLPSIVTFEHQYCCSAVEFLLTPSLFVGYTGTLYKKQVLEEIM